MCVFAFAGCKNPCRKLADRVCKLKGKNSKPCNAAKAQIKRSGQKEVQRVCKAGLELMEEMEKKDKKK